MNNEIIENPSIEEGKSKKQKTIIITSAILSFLLILGVILGLVFGLNSGDNSPTPPSPTPSPTPYHEKEIGNGDLVFTQAKQIFNIDENLNVGSFENGIANFDNININKTIKYHKTFLVLKMNIEHLKIIVKEENNFKTGEGISIEFWNLNMNVDVIISQQFNFIYHYNLETEYLFLEALKKSDKIINPTKTTGLVNIYGKNVKFSCTYIYQPSYFLEYSGIIRKTGFTFDTINLFGIYSNYQINNKNNELWLTSGQIKNLIISDSYIDIDTPKINVEFTFGKLKIFNPNLELGEWEFLYILTIKLFKFNEEWHFNYI